MDPTSLNTEPKSSPRAYVAKLQRIRQAVIGAGVPSSAVTSASYLTNPLGQERICFNSVLRYVRPNATSSRWRVRPSPRRAWPTTTCRHQPSAPILPMEPYLTALSPKPWASRENYAARVIAPRSVGEARASTLLMEESDSTPLSWRVKVTVTFVVP